MQHRTAAILFTAGVLLLRLTALVRNPALMVAMTHALIECSATHKHLVQTDQLRKMLLMLALLIVEETTQMHRQLVLYLAQVVLVMNVLSLVRSILASPTRHVITRTHTFVAQLGATRHQIAYFHARVVMMVTALIKHPVFPIHHVTRIKHSCADRALKTPLHASVLAHQEVAASVLLASHASPTQHAEQHQ